MKIIKIGLLFCCCSLFLGLVAFAEGSDAIAERELKRYFPGDFVHIIVNAPLDTAHITSILPNLDRLELAHDRRAKIWHGIWQVPIGFPSGSYSAVLEAEDLEGNVFSGETVPFIIGELTLITMVRKATTEAETREKRSIQLGLKAALLVPTAKPAPAVKIKPAAPAVPAKTRARASLPRPMSVIEVKEKQELNTTKVKLVAMTRYYMEKTQFDKVRASLLALIRLDPTNQDYRKMLGRVDAVLKAEKEKKK